jgi:hypothetical protein
MTCKAFADMIRQGLDPITGDPLPRPQWRSLEDRLKEAIESREFSRIAVKDLTVYIKDLRKQLYKSKRSAKI